MRRSKIGGFLGCMAFMAYIVLIIGILFLVFASGILVNKDIAIKALDVHGFSNIEIIDKDWFFVRFMGGGLGDAVRFTATATNPIGKEVEVYVFAGWPFKGATIRAK